MDYLISVPNEIKKLILMHIPVKTNDLDNIINAYPELIPIILSKNYWIDRFRHDGFGEWNDYIVIPDIKYKLSIDTVKSKLTNLRYIYLRIYKCFLYTNEIYHYLTEPPPIRQLQSMRYSCILGIFLP